MGLKGTATRLTIFIGEVDKVHGAPLFEAIVRSAREAGLAGATVMRGVESYGTSTRIHSAKVLRLSENLPLVIELVDTPGKIESFMDELDRLMDQAGGGGLVTVEPVEVIRYHPKRG